MMRRIKKVFLPAKTEERMIREELQMMLPGMIDLRFVDRSSVCFLGQLRKTL